MSSTVRRLLLTAALVALVSGGCGAGRAKSPAAPTPLDVPSPPPRIIVPPEPDVPRTAPPPPQATDAGTKPPKSTPKPTTPKPEAKTEPPATVEPPATAAPPLAMLQTQPPTTPGETRSRVQGQLSRASDILEKVKRDSLNADELSQYDTAKQFIAQARKALDEGNLVFAAKVADKAATLAAGLRVR